MYAERVDQLQVYQEARRIAGIVFEVTRTFPKSERFSLVDQMRRSSRAIGAQVAEAWGKRGYPRHFAAKLTDADAERLETQHWLTIASDCGYISAAERHQIYESLTILGRRINAMIAKKGDFAIRSK